MSASQVRRRARLVRQSTIGDFGAPGPRPVLRPDPVLERARWGLLPLSSIMRVDTEDRVFALTYDDGPEPAQTSDLLDVLAARGVRATFFVLTDRAEANPDIVRRMVRDGHEVALHGVDHTRLTTLPARVAAQRLRQGMARLQTITGRPPRYYRPTYGAVNLPLFLAARLAGLQVVIWSAWAQDWFDGPVEEVADRGAAALHPGAILLLHDTTDEPPEPPDYRPRPTFSRAEVAERLLSGSAAAGYRVLPLPRLLAGYPVVRALTVERPRLPVRGLR